MHCPGWGNAQFSSYTACQAAQCIVIAPVCLCVCLFVCLCVCVLFVGLPYYSQIAVFASPLSAFSLFCEMVDGVVDTVIQ